MAVEIDDKAMDDVLTPKLEAEHAPIPQDLPGFAFGDRQLATKFSRSENLGFSRPTNPASHRDTVRGKDQRMVTNRSFRSFPLSAAAERGPGGEVKNGDPGVRKRGQGVRSKMGGQTEGRPLLQLPNPDASVSDWIAVILQL